MAAPVLRKRFLGVAVVLVAIGCFALVVGSHDVFAARGLGPRLFGALLAVAGLIMLIAAAGIMRRAAWHVALSLVGSFSALLVGLALLLAELDAAAQGGSLLVWVLIIAAALAALALSLGPGAPQVSSAVRRIQLVAVAGMLIGIAQFVFTTVYGPAPAGPHLTITTALERVGERGDLVAVKARITLENSSERKLRVVDSVYRVSGHRVVQKPAPGFATRLANAAKSPLPGLHAVSASRHAFKGKAAVVNAGQVLERVAFWFEPGESWTTEFLVYAPRQRYDLLRLSVEVAFADYGRLNVADKPTEGYPKTTRPKYEGKAYTVISSRWQIGEPSWVRRLVQKENVLWSSWLLAGPGPRTQYPTTLTYVDEKGEQYEPWKLLLSPSLLASARDAALDDVNRVSERSNEYGAATAYSHAELSLLLGGTAPG